MMELPESFTLARQGNEFLKGKVISEMELLRTPHRFAFLEGDVDSYKDMPRLTRDFPCWMPRRRISGSCILLW